jgi:uroporphyrinogen-III synthase
MPDGANEIKQGVGRDWLAQQVMTQKAQIKWVVAYRRACPLWDPQRMSSALMATHDGSVWVFSSAQALSHLNLLLPNVSWHRAKAVATHPRIAQKAREFGFGQVITCLPTPQMLKASLESGA